MTSLAEGKIYEKGRTNLPRLLDEFKNRLDDEVGAIGAFVGIVRGKAKKEGKVKKLHYERAERAEEELEEIAVDMEKTEGISEVAIHHFVNDLEPGDDVVYVLAAGEHREEVFEILPKIMNRVKSEVKIWKKEITESESYWMHEVKK